MCTLSVDGRPPYPFRIDASDFALPQDTQDEENWEAFLFLAMERLGGVDANGLTNAEIAGLEAIVGTALPFEVGLLLVIGVPDDDHWWNWKQDPGEKWASWSDRIRDGVVFDVEYNNLWLGEWGPRPDVIDERIATASEHVGQSSPLFPLWGHRAVPLACSPDRDSAMGNPVLSIVQTDAIVMGHDLADWMHREFEIPLPTWPADTERYRGFGLWSTLIEG